MKSLIYVILLGISINLIYSCKEQPKEKTALDLMFDEVMVVHDEVMPLMSSMHKNQTSLKKYRTQVGLSEDLKNRIRTSVTNLENTQEAMMEWMAGFSDPQRDDVEKATAYFEDQKLRITKVSKAMKLAYEKSTVLLYDLKETENQ